MKIKDDKTYLEWNDITKFVNQIIEHIDLNKVKSIYGLPRGGLIPAVIISHITGIPLVMKVGHPDNCLIIDDICDTGKTLDRYLNNGYKCCTITNKFEHEKSEFDEFKYENLYSAIQINNWVVFPWETEESSKMDYLDNK